MNRLNLALLLGVLTIASCKKHGTNDQTLTPAADNRSIQEECQPPMYSLRVDSASGASLIYKVVGSPGAGPVVVSPYIISGTNQLTDCSGNAIKHATGLTFDPTSGIFYGTTGINGSVPNAIFRFTDPNCVTITPAVSGCAIALNLSDIERDQTTGAFYAINRGTVNPNNRIVRLGLPGSPTVGCLANALPVSLNMRGLTFDCNGQLFVIHTAGTTGIIVAVNKANGLNTASYTYPGPIAPFVSVPNPELGLHLTVPVLNALLPVDLIQLAIR